MKPMFKMTFTDDEGTELGKTFVAALGEFEACDRGWKRRPQGATNFHIVNIGMMLVGEFTKEERQMIDKEDRETFLS